MTTFTGTVGMDAFVGSDATDDIFNFTASHLNSGDSAIGGIGDNDTLNLLGGGTFVFSGVTLDAIDMIDADTIGTVLDFTGDELFSGLLTLGGNRIDLLFSILADFEIDSVIYSVGTSFATATLDSSGNLVSTVVYNAANTLYDTAVYTIAPDGDPVSTVVYFDNGDTRSTDFNDDGIPELTQIIYDAGPVASRSILYDNIGNVTERITDFNDGRKITDEYDPSDNSQYQRITSYFDIDGDIFRRFYLYDDESNVISRDFRYDENGVFVKRITIMDDGSKIIDQDGISRKINPDGTQLVRGDGNANIIKGGNFDDKLFGLGGSDVFEFGHNKGVDAIRDYEKGIDLIDLRAFGVDELADIGGRVSESGGNVIIDFSDLGTTIVISNYSLSDLSDSDFY